MNLAELMRQDSPETPRSSHSDQPKSEYIKFEEGSTVIRILPGTPEMEDGKFWVLQHYHTHQVGGRPDSVQCTKHSTGRCYICELIHPNAISPIKEVKDSYYAERSKPQYYFNVIDRTDGKVKIWQLRKTVFEAIRDIVCDEDYGNISDPVTGRDITVVRKGKDLQTTYSIIPKPKPSRVDTDYTPHPIHNRLKPIEFEAQKLWWTEGFESAKKFFQARREATAGVPSAPAKDDDIPF